MQPSTVYCDTCGAANRPQARFCIACGQAMPVGSMLPPTVQAAPVASSASPTVLAGSPPSTASPTGLLPAQSLLKQRYLILSQLGQGGMGAVYKAADTQLGDRLVAVKEMSQKGLDAQEIIEAAAAFKREAHLLAGLPHHSHLPSVYDYFEDGGRWYLVMDFIPGETLAEYGDKAGGKLPPEEVLDIGLQLATVLDYLHHYQPPIIFRDLKPANIMRTPKGDLFLIDFGIARHFKAGQAKDTVAYGSAGYAAPEQYGKAQTTPRSDIYSLGATLHHLLSGTDPSLSPFIFASLSNAGIPADLGALILHMVKTSAHERPASMDEVKQELQRIQRLAAQPQGKQLPPTQYAGGSSLPPTQLAVPTPAPAVPAQPSQARQAPKASPPSPPKPVMASSAAGTLLCAYKGHSHVVLSLAWSPDSKRIASASRDKTVQVWDAMTGKNLLTYRGHTKGVRAVTWSPDGRRIASGGDDDIVQVWDATTGSLLLTDRGFAGVTSGLMGVAWSPDGACIASCGYTFLSNNVQIWSATDASSIAKFGYAHTRPNPSPGVGSAYAVSWAPDSTHIAVAFDDGFVEWWNVTEKKERKVIFATFLRSGPEKKGSAVNDVAWSPDGTRIVACSDNTKVGVYDVKTKGKEPLTYHGHAVRVSSVAWSPDSKYIASAAGDSKKEEKETTVRVWNATSGDDVFIYKGHSFAVQCVAWSPDGTRIASTCRDTTVKIWQAPRR